jgi:hypothetical protein
MNIELKIQRNTKGEENKKIKVKVKFSLCLTKHHATKTYWGSGGIASHPGSLIPRERALGNHWKGGWVGPQSRYEPGGEEKKLPTPVSSRTKEPRSSSP